MDTTTDTTKIQSFQLRVVSNGYVVTISGEPYLHGEEFVFDSLTSLRDWISMRLPRFFSAEEKAQILKAQPMSLDGNSPIP